MNIFVNCSKLFHKLGLFLIKKTNKKRKKREKLKKEIKTKSEEKKYLIRIHKRIEKLPLMNKSCSNGFESKICSNKNESQFAAKSKIKTNIIVKMKN